MTYEELEKTVRNYAFSGIPNKEVIENLEILSGEIDIWIETLRSDDE